nr:MAG: replication associated protein [Arizlama virus]
MAQRVRNFCFTLNNWTVVEKELLKSSAEQFKFICFGEEVAPNTGTPHLQGYFQLRNAKTIAACQVFLRGLGCERMAVLVARGTQEQNIEYCSKGGIFWEAGERSVGQGKRSDLSQVIDVIKAGGDIAEVVEQCPEQFIKFSGGIQKLLTFRSEPRMFKTEVHWFYGPTGVGKSRKAWEDFPSAYSKDPTTKWWDGYCGQDTVILDDFRPSKEIPFHMMLRLLDRYPVNVEVKGATVNFAPKLIVITCSESPRSLFANCEWLGNEQMNQLERRIELLVEMGVDSSRVIWDKRIVN